MVTLEEAQERGLVETGDLTFAHARNTQPFSGGTAEIPEDKIPDDAIAFRVGRYFSTSNNMSGYDAYVPVGFYR